MLLAGRGDGVESVVVVVVVVVAGRCAEAEVERGEKR